MKPATLWWLQNTAAGRQLARRSGLKHLLPAHQQRKKPRRAGGGSNPEEGTQRR